MMGGLTEDSIEKQGVISLINTLACLCFNKHMFCYNSS